MKIIAYLSDQFAPSLFTVTQPGRALIRYGVHIDTQCTLPSLESAPGGSEVALINQIARYDLCLAQRVTSLPIVKMLKNACHLMDKPFVGVFDDNYIHLESHNPCWFSTSLTGLPMHYKGLREQQDKAQNEGREGDALEFHNQAEALIPQLLQDRQQGMDQLKESLGLYDLLIVTTEELREAYLPFNKNIKVLQNNIEQVFPERDIQVEQVDAAGRLQIESKFGLVTVPGYFYETPEKFGRVLRVGYTGTETHRHDFDTTVKNAWNRIVKKYASNKWFIYIGDSYFAETSYYTENARKIVIPSAAYETYRLNIRNLDIGIAPLAPTPFNMSKSDLKVMEYAAWGIPCVAPDYITYSRNWTHNENILLYKNEEEFAKYIEELLTNEPLRRKLGRNALQYVTDNRQEYQHAEERYNILKELCDSKPRWKTIPPIKKEIPVNV